MKKKNEMKAFLKMMAKFHMENGQASLPALLLKKGSWFEGRAGSDEYAVAKNWKKKRKPKAQDCFYNSQKFCTENTGARYFEGFVIVQSGISPSEHAWVVMQDGRVVDFTLEALKVIIAKTGNTVDSAETLYVGLEVPKAFIVERLDESDWYDSIAELFYADQIKQIANAGF